jgi:hypothetical protein
MLSPMGEGLKLVNDDTGGADSSLELSCGIARNGLNTSGTTFQHPTLSSVRAYCALYDFTPKVERLYLSHMSSEKVIKYKDFLSFQVPNVGKGANFNNILTNSISRARKLIIVPFISASENYAGPESTISPMNSPFSSSPNTTSKNALTNFNVLVSGTNLYQQNINYSVEHFLQEVRKTNSLNGGESLQQSSGLINQLEYENSYRYIVSDLSRTVSEVSDNVSKSIQIVGTNTGKYAVDLYCFLEFERQIRIDMNTGQIII